MTIMIATFLLQSNVASGAGAQGASMWIMLIALFLVMYLFMIRPQRKQQKALEQMRNSLKKGDKVITAGGIYGTVADVDDFTVVIRVDGDVKLRVDKSSIQKDMSDEQKAAAAAAQTAREEKKKKKEEKTPGEDKDWK